MARTATVVMPLLLLLLLSSWSLTDVMGYNDEWRREEEWPEPEGRAREEGRRGLFVLDKFEKVVDSEGGQVRVVRGFPWPHGWGSGAGRKGLMHIGFISMEPKTLFVPQYLDSSLILFVHRGEVKVGWIHKDALVERKLKIGDVLHIGAGSTFYMVNTGKGQRLQIICSIDASESIGFSPYQAFFIGGGRNPRSVLAGFDPKILTTAFNVTYHELESLFMKQTRGPIVYVTGEPGSRGEWEGEEREKGGRHEHERRERENGREEDVGCNESWSWRKLLSRIVGGSSNAQLKAKDKPVRSPDPYNLYDRDPDFRNNYGWSIALDEHAYAPLKHSDIGVYIVNLTAGSMMAPHVNPRATEYGIVLAGSGIVQVVFPNGSLAMSAEVTEGDAFWIPWYFPFCHVASRSGPMEFFGFTTSSRRNRPQFLMGASSVLRTMLGPELAAGFGVSEAELRDAVKAQKESVILPSWPEPRKGERRKEREEDEPLLIKQMIFA